MPETLSRFELVVGNLAHELGTNRHPLRVFAARPPAQPSGHAAWIGSPLLLRNLCLQRLELGYELFALRCIERRGVTDVVHRSFLVVQAQEQRAKRRAVAGLAPADDHAVGGALMLDLHPVSFA